MNIAEYIWLTRRCVHLSLCTSFSFPLNFSSFRTLLKPKGHISVCAKEIKLLGNKTYSLPAYFLAQPPDAQPCFISWLPFRNHLGIRMKPVRVGQSAVLTVLWLTWLSRPQRSTPPCSQELEEDYVIHFWNVIKSNATLLNFRPLIIVFFQRKKWWLQLNEYWRNGVWIFFTSRTKTGQTVDSI